MTFGCALYHSSFAQAQAKFPDHVGLKSCRLAGSQCCELVMTTGSDQQADLDFPPPEFEGTATADLLEALALIASWLKLSLCMIDQVLLGHVVKYRFHPP